MKVPWIIYADFESLVEKNTLLQTRPFRKQHNQNRSSHAMWFWFHGYPF